MKALFSTSVIMRFVKKLRKKAGTIYALEKSFATISVRLI
jgi:hypothetical protein